MRACLNNTYQLFFAMCVNIWLLYVSFAAEKAARDDLFHDLIRA
jgi:hypothetical protein